MRNSDCSERPQLSGVVCHPRRRACLLLVAIAPERGIRLWPAAELIRTLEIGVLPDGVERESVVTLVQTLDQTHLPALAAAGLITVTDTDHIQAGPRFEEGLRLLLSTQTASSE